ncbi:hypothetical protein C8R44DRAFT_851996 [Mycena epipterygia]|nr:hypothetical protein C8R44DRAFT_851996 [Mycena epipterygia]
MHCKVCDLIQRLRGVRTYRESAQYFAGTPCVARPQWETAQDLRPSRPSRPSTPQDFKTSKASKSQDSRLKTVKTVKPVKTVKASRASRLQEGLTAQDLSGRLLKTSGLKTVKKTSRFQEGPEDAPKTSVGDCSRPQEPQDFKKAPKTPRRSQWDTAQNSRPQGPQDCKT